MKTKLAARAERASRSDSRAPRRGARPARATCATMLFEGSKRARARRRRDDGPRARRDEDFVPMTDRSPRFRIGARRLSGQAVELRGPARSAAAPDQEERGQHPRHSDRADHRAVPRRDRPDAGAEPRRRRRVPRDGGDADPHQVEDAAAASRDRRRRRGRGRGSARRAGAPAARAPEVQGRRRAAARARAAARRAVAAARRARRRASPATTTSPSSRSICSAC